MYISNHANYSAFRIKQYNSLSNTLLTQNIHILNLNIDQNCFFVEADASWEKLLNLLKTLPHWTLFEIYKANDHLIFKGSICT